MAEQLLIPGGSGRHGYLITKQEEGELWDNLPDGQEIGYLGDLLDERLEKLTANHSIVYTIPQQEPESWEQIQLFYSQLIRFECNPILIALVREMLDATVEAHAKNWGHWQYREPWYKSLPVPYRKMNAEGKTFGAWMRIEDEAITFIGEGVEHINKEADINTDENIDSLFKFLDNSKPYPTLFNKKEPNE